jgi:uncharacterized protein
MNIVIDSNVWISALVFGGTPSRLFKHIIAEGWTIVVSEEIFTEVRRIIEKKFPLYLNEFDNLKRILGHRLLTVPLGSVHVNVCRDPDDNRVIETAVIGRATHIISGDKDLLVLGRYNDIVIVSPSDFLSS